MKIKIDENLRIINDAHGFILQEYRGIVTPTKPNKEGVIPPPYENWKNVGCYGILEHAINGVMRYRLQRSTAESLAELKSDIERYKSEVSELFSAHTTH